MKLTDQAVRLITDKVVDDVIDRVETFRGSPLGEPEWERLDEELRSEIFPVIQDVTFSRPQVSA